MPARRLYRSRHDQIIGGVCAGIADHFDVDPVLVRLGAAGITFLGFPFAIVGYIVCWVIIPEEPRPSRPPAPPAGEEAQQALQPDPSSPDSPSPPPPPPPPPPPAYESMERESRRKPGMTGGCILVLIGLFFLMINLDFFHWHDLRFWRWPFFLPVILIGFGCWFLFRAVIPDGSDRNG